MEEFLIFVLIVILLIHWLYVRRRFRQFEARMDALSRALALRPIPPKVTPPLEAPPAVAEVFVEQPIPVHQAAAASGSNGIAPPEAPSTDWEAVIGGNWLNKLGMFVLVIGMALALGYSFRYLGPAGRIAISAAVSIAMIVSGAAFEPRDRYRTFARGLIGGGWAALYFTAYAMYAVDSARVIHNPVAAALVLLAVATGMILQSLRYRSEAVAGLAYFIAFVTLAITEVTALSVIALVPLAASLLYIARRFAWSRFALLGLVATYVTCALRGDTGSPLWQAQAIFTIYWLLFEAFDILSRTIRLLPLSAVGFVGLSLVKWDQAAPDRVWQFLAAASVAYLASAALRLRAGRWPAAVAVAAALAAGSIFLKLDQQWRAVALLLEAELIYLAGLRLGVPFLRYVAGGVFALQVGHLLLWERTDAWTSMTALTASVFYLNRFLGSGGTIFGYAGAGLLALIAGHRAPDGYRGLTWVLMSPSPFAVGWLRPLPDFRFQAYGLALLGLGGLALSAPDPPYALGISAALFFAGALAASRPERFLPRESEALLLAAPFIGTALLAAELHRQVSGSMLTVAWGAEGLALLAAGFPLRHRMVRLSGLTLLLVCILKLFLYDLNSLETLPRILSFMGLGLILVGVSWLYTRFRERIRRYL